MANRPDSSQPANGDQGPATKRGWATKFANAFRGISLGVHGQNSFVVHAVASVAVAVAAIWLRVNPLEACALSLAVGLVLSAELLNSALERLAQAITAEQNKDVGSALDIASGAVLIAAIFAALVGAFVFLPKILY